MRTLISKVIYFLREEDAPTAVEYAVMLGLIAAVVLTGAQVLGNATNTFFSDMAATLASY